MNLTINTSYIPITCPVTMYSDQSNDSEGSAHMKHFGTNAIHAGYDPDQWNCKAVMPPIFTATTFKQNSPGNYIRTPKGLKLFLMERCYQYHDAYLKQSTVIIACFVHIKPPQFKLRKIEKDQFFWSFKIDL